MVRGTRTDATWHARPRGRAMRAHAVSGWHGGGVEAWQGQASPRGHPGDTTWLVRGLAGEGPMG